MTRKDGSETSETSGYQASGIDENVADFLAKLLGQPRQRPEDLFQLADAPGPGPSHFTLPPSMHPGPNFVGPQPAPLPSLNLDPAMWGNSPGRVPLDDLWFGRQGGGGGGFARGFAGGGQPPSMPNDPALWAPFYPGGQRMVSAPPLPPNPPSLSPLSVQNDVRNLPPGSLMMMPFGPVGGAGAAGATAAGARGLLSRLFGSLGTGAGAAGTGLRAAAPYAIPAAGAGTLGLGLLGQFGPDPDPGIVNNYPNAPWTHQLGREMFLNPQSPLGPNSLLSPYRIGQGWEMATGGLRNLGGGLENVVAGASGRPPVGSDAAGAGAGGAGAGAGGAGAGGAGAAATTGAIPSQFYNLQGMVRSRPADGPQLPPPSLENLSPAEYAQFANSIGHPNWFTNETRPGFFPNAPIPGQPSPIPGEPPIPGQPYINNQGLRSLTHGEINQAMLAGHIPISQEILNDPRLFHDCQEQRRIAGQERIANLNRAAQFDILAAQNPDMVANIPRNIASGLAPPPGYTPPPGGMLASNHSELVRRYQRPDAKAEDVANFIISDSANNNPNATLQALTQFNSSAMNSFLGHSRSNLFGGPNSIQQAQTVLQRMLGQNYPGDRGLFWRAPNMNQQQLVDLVSSITGRLGPGASPGLLAPPRPRTP